MNNAELAWTAGLLEGEASFTLYKSDSGILRPRIQINMTDLDVLEHLQSLIHDSRLTGPYNQGHKPFWTWSLNKTKSVVALCRILQPLMGIRRQAKIDELLDNTGKRWRPMKPRGRPKGSKNKPKLCRNSL